MQQPERTPRFCAFCGCELQLLEVDVSHLLDVTRRVELQPLPCRCSVGTWCVSDAAARERIMAFAQACRGGASARQVPRLGRGPNQSA
jgi:hypothetical protein